ncbi:MAG: small ribosomal subunit Rsm22 family protein, partial [Deltaproteobacteria bacterium]|nr:small ribosomal subunit Rsm22 family protein [Deltaproteobacteria bacterium]
MRFFKITREEATCIEQIYLKAFFGKASMPPIRKTGIPGILLKLHRDFITRPTKVFYDEKKSRAYAVYFGLISSLKLYGIFKFFIPEISSLKTLLDFGCGTGASLVPLDLLGFRGTFFGADRSRSQIFQALQLRRFVSFPSQFTRRNVNGPFDAIIVSNVISEISANLRKSIVRNLAKKLSPEGRLILVEPGDYVKTQSLLRLKSVLVDDGLTTIFPCPGDYPCPLLGTEDWCHVC